MKKYLTPIIFAIVVLGIAIFAIIALRSPDKTSSANSNTTISSADLATLQTGHDEGPAGAKVTLTEFGDYQCPACGAAFPILKDQILPQFSGRIRFVFKNFPLSQLHPNALNGAEAAEAAGAQGKYWEMHDLLYAGQNDWATSSDPVPVFGKYASQLGLDANLLMSEVRAKKYNDIIQTDINFGNKLKVQGTPTFYVNNQPVDISTSGLSAVVNALNAALAQ